MIAYVDTSTLIKLFIEEPGSVRAQLIWEQAETLATVRVTSAEACAALAAAARASRLTSVQHASAARELELMLASVHLVEITAELVEHASQLAATHSLRGYDAVHLAGAITAGAEILTSADTRLCAAARASGLHVLNPQDGTPDDPSNRSIEDLEQIVGHVTNPLATAMNEDSGIFGIPVPSTSHPDPDRTDFRLVSGLGTIQELVAFYRDWMGVDGWIFDADSGHPDPYAMEQRSLGGYCVQLFFVKPTTPPTTVSIIVGNADAQPGHKQQLTIHIGITLDDALPRRSCQLGPHYTSTNPTDIV